MTRQELEEINDNLQVQIAGLQKELLNAPPRELAEENERLKEEITELRAQLEDSEAVRSNLRGMVDAFQRQRANELAELREGREQLSDLRQIELNRLGEAATQLAAEREELATEREEMEEEVTAATSAREKALATAEGWRKQSTEMYQRMTRAQEEKERAVEKLQVRELDFTRLSSQVQDLRMADTRAEWIQFVELLANNAGMIWLILLGFTLLMFLLSVVIWIWNWMWS
jgi:chromosome segregation ATPase